MTNYKPKNMLVTGGAGFIGANFIRHALAHEPKINIINLDLLTYAGSLKNLENLSAPERYHFVQGDIADNALIKQIMQQHEIDTIVHFAAESHVDRSISLPIEFVKTNLLGTFVLLEAAKSFWLDTKKWDAQRCRFHHISTDEVYGALTPECPGFTESRAYQPRSPYSASKAGSDHLVQAYHHTYRLPITISNCSNNYGPYQHAEKFIPTVIRSCLNWQAIPVYGNGKNIRDWLYVEDHCAGVMRIIKQGKIGEAYNIGGDNEWENIKIAEYICAVMDRLQPRSVSYTSLIQYVTDRPGHDFRYAIDARKIKMELGWQARESFISGMEKTIKYYLNN